MKNYFGLLKSSKRFRIYTILINMSWVVFIVLSFLFAQMEINKIESHELNSLYNHYQIQFEKQNAQVFLIESYFDEHSIQINQDEFVDVTSRFDNDEAFKYVSLDHSSSTEFVYPNELYNVNEMLGFNIMEHSTPHQRNELIDAIESKELIYQFEYIDNVITTLYIRKALFINEEFYGFITLALEPSLLGNSFSGFDSDYVDIGLFTKESEVIVGNQSINNYKVKTLTFGDTEIIVGGAIATSQLQLVYLQYMGYLIVLSLALLITHIYIFKNERKICVLAKDLDYRINYDSDTNLFNVDRLYEDFDRLKKENDIFYIAQLNILNVKYINDKFGYKMTIDLLKKTTGLIRRVLRNNSTMYRYGGDEYIITIETKTRSEVQNLIRRISKIFDNDITVGSIRARLGIEVGIVEYPANGSKIEELIKNSHLAASQISRYEKECFKFFDQDKINSMISNEDFDKSVQNLNLELFEVNLMPIVDVQTNKITGFECLTRCYDEFGNKLPTEPVVLSLERNGRIQELDQIVFRKMLQIMKRINKEFPEEEFFLSLNASALSFNDEYVRLVTSLYKQSKLDRGQIVIELTESYQVEDYDYLVDLFNQLIAKGIKVAIDDFGSGYSSISYIAKFPIYAIKVDKQYVCDYDTNKFNRTLLKTLKSISDVLECKLVAEGVDSIDTLEYLQEAGCPFYQGFLFSQGVTLDEAFTLIKTHNIDINE